MLDELNSFTACYLRPKDICMLAACSHHLLRLRSVEAFEPKHSAEVPTALRLHCKGWFHIIYVVIGLPLICCFQSWHFWLMDTAMKSVRRVLYFSDLRWRRIWKNTTTKSLNVHLTWRISLGSSCGNVLTNPTPMLTPLPWVNKYLASSIRFLFWLNSLLLAAVCESIKNPVTKEFLFNFIDHSRWRPAFAKPTQPAKRSRPPDGEPSVMPPPAKMPSTWDHPISSFHPQWCIISSAASFGHCVVVDWFWDHAVAVCDLCERVCIWADLCNKSYEWHLPFDMQSFTWLSRYVVPWIAAYWELVPHWRLLNQTFEIPYMS